MTVTVLWAMSGDTGRGPAVQKPGRRKRFTSIDMNVQPDRAINKGNKLSFVLVGSFKYVQSTLNMICTHKSKCPITASMALTWQAVQDSRLDTSDRVDNYVVCPRVESVAALYCVKNPIGQDQACIRYLVMKLNA